MYSKSGHAAFSLFASMILRQRHMKCFASGWPAVQIKEEDAKPQVHDISLKQLASPVPYLSPDLRQPIYHYQPFCCAHHKSSWLLTFLQPPQPTWLQVSPCALHRHSHCTVGYKGITVWSWWPCSNPLRSVQS